jgi:hypothetical protein
MTKTLTHLVRAGAAVAALSAFATGANAALVQTPFGDPFPAGSFVILTPSAAFETPFGWVESILLSNFSTNTPTDLGADDYQYTDTTVRFTNDFVNTPGGTKVGSFVGQVDATGFVSVVYDRLPSFVSPGDFSAEITSATFNGDVFNLAGTDVGDLTTRVNPTTGFATAGTANFTGTVPDQFVETLFLVRGQFNAGSGFEDTPNLQGSSNPTPTAAVPVPATAALLIPGMLGMVALRRRRTVAVA